MKDFLLLCITISFLTGVIKLYHHIKFNIFFFILLLSEILKIDILKHKIVFDAGIDHWICTFVSLYMEKNPPNMTEFWILFYGGKIELTVYILVKAKQYL